jgi:DNA-directed RNA polymerase subunit RPC12/RpoP
MLLRCDTCGTEVPIKAVEAQITEHSLDEWEAKNKTTLVANIAAHELRCQSCGATTETTDLASKCQFCGGVLVATDRPEGLVPPEAVIPFQVQRKQAHEAFGGWVTSRWFAPNALKKVGATEGLTGTYIPHWTYDSHTETDYVGQRGDHYYTTETRQVSDGQGGTRTETYQVQHTAWRHASGHVARTFDDVLVLGAHTLDPKKVNKMGPWRLGDAKPFQDEFLTGFSALRYDVDPQAGSELAKQQMVSVIEDDVRGDIGGDEQRISSLDVAYSNNTFKLLLMPLWIATYVFAGKTWQVMVNANTGEVVGDRPYSPWKIAFATVLALVVVAAIIAAVVLSRRQ